MNALDISDYAGVVQLCLSEAGKYLLLLLLAVLAVRLWRQLSRSSGSNSRKIFLLATITSALAVVVGYYSVRHSLGRLYFHYGAKAVSAGNVWSGLTLFQTSARNWKTADALGGEGICMLWTGMTNQGTEMLAQARTMRKRQTFFEDYYEGLYFFYQNRWDLAAPLLSEASADVLYRWNSVKLVSLIELEQGNPQMADSLMKPFAGADVTDYDQAYVMASLDLWKGKKKEAQTLAEKYKAADLPPFWKSRFEKLDAELLRQTP